MNSLAWIGIAWLASCVMTALRSHGGFAYVMPDPAIVVITFLAMRREALQVVIVALVLGYLIGRQDLAPAGLYPLAMGVVALGTQLVSGAVAVSGVVFAALMTAAATAAYHALLFALLYGLRGNVGFASWATAALFPSALATAVLGLLALPFLAAVEKKLAPDTRTALSWR
jgi:hypothetical protein